MACFSMKDPSAFPCNPAQSLEDFYSLNQKLVTVFLGTYAFVFIGCGSLYMEKKGDITLVGVAIAWGAAVTSNIYTFGHISGAHINPALTFAYAIAGQFPWKQVPLYVIFEFLGATIASYTLRWIFDGISPEVMLTQPVGPNPVSDLKAVMLEIIIAFMYTITSCGSRSDTRAFRELGGVAVGAIVSIDALVAGKITGAALNPARSLGPAIIVNNYYKIWIYMISPVIGAVSATTLYFFYLMPKPVENKIQDGVVFDDEYNNPAFTNYSGGSISVKSNNHLEFSGKSMEIV